MADERNYNATNFINLNELCKAYLLKYDFSEGSTIQGSGAEYPVYIKFGYLLAFLNNMCLLYESADDKNNDNIKPYVYIDFSTDYNFCLTTPQHLTVDPYKCLLPLQATKDQYLQLFPSDIRTAIEAEAFNPGTENLFSSFIGKFKTDNPYQGKIMEILLNAQYLLDVANQFLKADSEGAVAFKPFLDRIVQDINKATGGFNLFRVAYRDDSNTIIIKDDQWVPGISGEPNILSKQNYIANTQYAQLPIFGSGSIAREMEFKTNMSTKMSSMVAISATSTTAVANSTDATPLGTYNNNYDDAFMPKKLNSVSTGSSITTVAQASEQEKEKQRILNNNVETAKKFNSHVRSIYYTGRVSKAQVDSATAYYIDRLRIKKGNDKITTAAPFIPANLSITLDGISGIVMGNAFTIPENRLPASLKGDDLQTKVGFTVVGLTHTLEQNQWLTKIRGQMIRLRESVDYGTTSQIGAAGGNVTQIETTEPTTTQGGAVGTASGCTTAYPELLPELPSVQVELLSYTAAATYLKNKHPDIGPAVFAIMFAEAGKSGANFRSAGGNNFGGVQTDNRRWGFGNFTGQFCRRDSGKKLRMFAAFPTPYAFLDFMANRVRDRGFTNSPDQWTALYIAQWWSPAEKESYTKGTVVYNNKLATYNDAISRYNKA